jgi:hypothetical protein
MLSITELMCALACKKGSVWRSAAARTAVGSPSSTSAAVDRLVGEESNRCAS